MTEETEMDYSASSGATSEQAAYNDSRAPDSAKGDVGATTFDPTDADDPERFEQLRKRHHGHFDQDGSNSVSEDIKYDTELVCSRLECTPAQTNRVKMLTYNNRVQGRRYEVTILAAARIVLNRDGRWIQRDDDEYGDERASVYHELMDDFSIEEPTIRTAIDSMRNTDSKRIVID